LPYNSNQVKFTFSSLLTKNLENIEFSYQLEGFGEKWVVVKQHHKRIHQFKGINYKMKLEAQKQLWIQSGETSIEFRVSPWFRNSSAYLFYLLIATGLVYFYSI
jgi:hypothetical protein